ncbi:unnamed protein product [Debaryomyces fabryi]|nr:unnamed protein product [Debaryomyces fabryi]
MSENYRPTIPGLFPNDLSVAPGTESRINTKAVATNIIDEENNSKFRNKQFIVQKTRHQQNLIAQLDTLVYLLVGYQFIKYCHSACILPVLLHIIVQKILSCSSITGDPNSGGIHVINEAVTDFINRRRQNNAPNDPSRDDLINTIFIKACSIVYWKAIVTCAYHILFVCTWMVLIVNDDKLKMLENGTWWFISFIGESTPEDITNETNYWYKLFQLGLPGLLVSDIIILFIQLVLLQCIYKQSTVSPIGRSLNEDEINLIRQAGDFSSIPDRAKIFGGSVPWILLIKLYELFERKSFTEF